MKRLSREILAFAGVGVAASATHVAVGLAAAHLLGLAPLVANILGFCAAVGVSYLGNSAITFGSDVRSGSALARFCIASLIAFSLNQAIVFCLTVLAGWPYAASLAVVVVTVPPLTFLACKYWALTARV